MSDNYMKHPQAKTLEAWRIALGLFEKYGVGKQRYIQFVAGHDILYCPLRLEDCPENSEDGKLLNSLGWHADRDGECWAYFT